MAPPSSPLVGVPELLARTGRDDRLVVLDVRYRLGGAPGAPDHRAGHVPGAVFVDMDTDLAAAPGPAGRHPLPAPERLQDVFRAAGIDADSHVVVYDDGNGLSAGRAWWLLRWAGMPAAHVAVLDGGWAAWTESGGPVEIVDPQPRRGDLVVVAGSMPTVDAEGAATAGRDGVLVDARAAVRYRGESEPIDPVAGHVPGAHNVPVLDFAGPDSRWHTPERLAELFAGVDVGTDPAAAYCGSGITAAALVLAAELAGLRPPEDPLPLYPGSWSNWIADPQRPVATGPYAPADGLR